MPESGVRKGTARAPGSAVRLARVVPAQRGRTPDGAVTAFATLAEWLLASPAAAADPRRAVTAAAGALDLADATTLVSFDRSGGVTWAVRSGAYRVLGFGGAAAAPAQVMVEVAAPLTADGRTRWAVVGGVVKWTPGGWTPISLRVRSTGTRAGSGASVRALSSAARGRVLPGLGWRTFAATTGAGR